MAHKFMLPSLSAAIVCGAAAYAFAGFTLPGPAKVAFLYFAEKTDGGWTQAFDEARPKIESAIGMQMPYVENVPEVAGQIRPAAERFIQRGFNVIIGTAFGYSDTFKELSEKYPKVAFLNASGTTNGPNLESFYGRTYESQYLCGMVAGAVSKTGKLGFVAAHPIGPVNWTINAYELGVQKMNPNAIVTVIFTGAWNDPVKERAAAQAMADQGNSGRYGTTALVDRAAMRRDAKEAVATYDVQGVRNVNQKAALLSGGNAQKLVIAREFSRQPTVVVAHSPSRGLDARACAAVHERLIAARDRGAGVLLISEDLDEILTLSDRIGVITRGRIVAEFTRPADRQAIGRAMVDHA